MLPPQLQLDPNSKRALAIILDRREITGKELMYRAEFDEEELLRVLKELFEKQLILVSGNLLSAKSATEAFFAPRPSTLSIAKQVAFQ